MVVMFRDGGPFMYFILISAIALIALGMLALILAIASRFVPALMWPARIGSFLGFGANVVTAALGIVAWWLGMQQVHAAIDSASADMKQSLLAQGSEVAGYPMTFGFWGCAIGALVWLLPLGIAMIPAHRNYDAMSEEV